MITATAHNTNGKASVIDTARAYVASGLSVLPIRTDGSKAPAGLDEWTPFQQRKPTDAELRGWFANGSRGVAVVYGSVSGNAECIDFDRADLFEPFKAECERVAPGLIARLTVVHTPRPGYHVAYRCDSIEGNQGLAYAENPETKGKRKTTIETRGTGGYALAPGCPLSCNPNDDGRLYEHVSGPPLTALPAITPAERQILFRVARSLNEWFEDEPKSSTSAQQPTGLAPGNDYNVRATWEEILEPHDWIKNHVRGKVAFWRRPGKDVGWSATSGNVSRQGNEVFCCFSDNAYPFEGAAGVKPCSTYTKFAAFALLNHQGSFSDAARDLGRKGYGERQERRGMADLRPAEYRDTVPDEPRRKIEYTRISSAELATGDYEIEYLAEHTLVAGQPLIIAGPQKTLKTSILIDAAISLETAATSSADSRSTGLAALR